MPGGKKVIASMVLYGKVHKWDGTGKALGELYNNPRDSFANANLFMNFCHMKLARVYHASSKIKLCYSPEESSTA